MSLPDTPDYGKDAAEAPTHQPPAPSWPLKVVLDLKEQG